LHFADCRQNAGDRLSLDVVVRDDQRFLKRFCTSNTKTICKRESLPSWQYYIHRRNKADDGRHDVIIIFVYTSLTERNDFTHNDKQTTNTM